MNKPIDYDADFKVYFEKWYEKNKDNFEKPEDVEQVLPQIYDKWIAAACGPLMSLSGAELVAMISKYAACGDNVPDIICELIVRRKKETEKELYNLYKANMFAQDIKVLIINLLAEMDSPLPIESFINTVASAYEEDEIANACAEALTNTGCDFLAFGINAYKNAVSTSARELLLNALIGKYKDKRLTDFVIALYCESSNKAFVAAMMGELGDERCLPVLRKAETSKEINYVDYTEICNAIEMLGGDVARNREFDGDVYYEMMKQGLPE